MKAYLRIHTPGRAYAWLLGFGAARTLLDYFWLPQHSLGPLWWLTLFNTTTYQFTLFLTIPALIAFLLQHFFSIRVDLGAMLRDSVLIWAAYPAVSAISQVLRDPPTRTIEWFRYIPTFMVDYNFLPAGMLAVIPILIVFYTRLALRHSAASLPRAMTAVVGSLYLFYLVYYQYTTQLFLVVIAAYGPIAVWGYYNLACVLPPLLLAPQFHVAFGPHRLHLPRLAQTWTYLNVGVLLLALAPAFFPGIFPPALPSPVLSGARWNLRAFQLYDQTDALAAYGYYLDLNAAGSRNKSFWLSQPDAFFFPNIERVRSDAHGLSYGNLLEIQVGDSKLTLDRKRAGTHGDPIRDSLSGHDAILECAASLAGESFRCFMLDEELLRLSPKPASWASETLMAVTGKDLSLIAFSAGDYTDGIIALSNRRHRVTSVTRHDSEVRIAFQGGTAVADCTLLAEYQTMRVVEPQPVDSPARCEVIIRPDRGPEFTTSVDGLLERIGTTQGSWE